MQGMRCKSLGRIDVRQLDDLAQWLHFDDIGRLFLLFDGVRPIDRRARYDNLLGGDLLALGAGASDIGRCGLVRLVLLTQGGRNNDQGGGGRPHFQIRHVNP